MAICLKKKKKEKMRQNEQNNKSFEKPGILKPKQQ